MRELIAKSLGYLENLRWIKIRSRVLHQRCCSRGPRRFSAIDANATLILAQTSTPAAATIAKSAMQTYIDGIRDLAELVV